VHDGWVREGRDHRVEELYREQGARLWRAVLAYTGDREVANDAVAEAFAQALRRGKAIRRPLPWIWRAAFRIAAGELAGRARFADMEVQEGEEDPVGQEGFADLSGSLMGALRKLSPMQRGSLVLHYFAGYPVRETARILGSTSAAVRVHLSRGRRRLRRLLEEDGA
jgi:RNA polymerase sigma-70 factor (ECF subfamily)